MPGHSGDVRKHAASAIHGYQANQDGESDSDTSQHSDYEPM